MKQVTSSTLTRVYWNEIKDEVRQVNPSLFIHLDCVDNGKNLPLVLAQYPFGCDILKAGTLFLPEGEQAVCPISNSKAPKAILSDLHYSKIPVGLILSKSIEIYYETQERIIADKIWQKGRIFGLWELHDAPYQEDSAQLSNISAGARSIFMLPKITDQVSHRKLQKNLGITSPAPASERDHRDLFAEIVAKSEDGQKWKCRILYLSAAWFKNQNNLAFQSLKGYFLQEAWHQSYNCRRQFELNVSWENSLKWMSERNIYLSPRVSSHVKQLYLIAENIFPGMVFAKQKEDWAAPVNLITHIYQDIYQLKHYDPLITHANHIEHSNPVYYSLRYPNYFESHIPMKSTPRLAEEISMLANIIGMIKYTKHFNIKPEFNFYHFGKENTPPVYSADHLIKSNPDLNQFIKNKKSGAEFPVNSTFFHGCVEIKLQN